MVHFSLPPWTTIKKWCVSTYVRIKASRYLQKKKDILLLVTVVQTYYTMQHRADWKEANRTRDLIIHDSTRNPNSVIVSLYIFLRLRLSLYDFDTYEMNSLTACLNSFLFLKCSFFGSLSVSIKMISLPSSVLIPTKKKEEKLHVFTSKLRGIQRTSLRPYWRVIASFHFILECHQK